MYALLVQPPHTSGPGVFGPFETEDEALNFREAFQNFHDAAPAEGWKFEEVELSTDVEHRFW